MNAMFPAPQADGGRLQGVLAYVSDAESEAALKRAAIGLALPGFEARRGDITTATRDLLTQRSPALLFVDVSDCDRVLEAVQALSDVCEPQLQVVVIGTRNDVGLFRGLLRLGVSDYLFKPVTADLVEQLISRLTSTPGSGADSRLGKLVSVVGARGGVGTSSIAVATAHYLAQKAGRRVLLIDLDTRHGALALLTGTRPNAGLADALAQPGRIDDLFIERATIRVSDRLDLMASELDRDRLASPAPVSPEAVDALIGRLQRAYHYVVVDVPQPVLPQAEALLDAANVQLLVSNATLLAARDTAVAQGAANPFNQRQILVHNQAGRPGDLSAADYGSALKRPPDVAIPFLPAGFGTAINLAQPVWEAEPRAEAAIGLLVRELSGQAVAGEAVPAWKRWLGLAP